MTSTSDYGKFFRSDLERHRAFLVEALNQLLKHDPKALAEGSKLRTLWDGAAVKAAPAGWDEVVRIARRAGARYPELVAAQWALESSYGKATSGRNNFFGLKGSGPSMPTKEVVNGKEVTVVAQFIDFGSIDDCIQYLVDRWYKDFKAHKGVNNAPSRSDAAKELQKQGYATDPSYAGKLIALMEQHASPPAANPATASAPAVAVPKPKDHLRLVRSGTRDARGLELLNLSYIRDGGKAGEIKCVSGAPGAQAFRAGPSSQAGSMEPLPEGVYSIENIAWAGGADNYKASWGAGLGPVSIPVHYLGPGKTGRSAIEIHIDWNARVAPGTAGCVGVFTEADMRTLVSWLRTTDPQRLFVDWGLGTCPKPKA